jgi:hypothetical protein
VNGTIGGGEANEIWSTGSYGTIGGGYADTVEGTYATIAGGFGNSVGWGYTSVGGGRRNKATSWAGTIGGGDGNHAGGGVAYAAIVGGHANTASGFASFIGGGETNTVTGATSTIAGGVGNSITSHSSAIAGGAENSIAGFYAAIPGGLADTLDVDANYAMAFGYGVYGNTEYRAIFFDSTHPGTIRINCDDREVNGAPGDAIIVAGTLGFDNGNGAYLSAGGDWMSSSSRSVKENFRPLDGNEILDKLSRVPIERWDYVGTNEHHIGPMAEDFVAAFDVGSSLDDGTRDNKHLSARDVAGVALIGVQELSRITQELRKKTDELDELRAEMTRMRALLETILAERSRSSGGGGDLEVSK